LKQTGSLRCTNEGHTGVNHIYYTEGVPALSTNHYSESFLDPLAKLRKATISFVASDSPSVRTGWIFIKYDLNTF